MRNVLRLSCESRALKLYKKTIELTGILLRLPDLHGATDQESGKIPSKYLIHYILPNMREFWYI